MGPLLNAPWEIIFTMIFEKGRTCGELSKKSLHQNIDNFMSYGPINMRVFLFSLFWGEWEGGSFRRHTARLLVRRSENSILTISLTV